jgi:hypothetical protein
MSFCVYAIALKRTEDENRSSETLVDMCSSTHFYSVLYALQQSCAVVESVFVSQTLNYDDTQKTLAQLTKWLQEPTKDTAAFLPTNVKIVSHEMNVDINNQASFYRIKALLQLALKRIVG